MNTVKTQQLRAARPSPRCAINDRCKEREGQIVPCLEIKDIFSFMKQGVEL